MTRVKNRSKVLIRRSSDHQEASLLQQLNWANGKAAEIDVPLDASPADLEYAQAQHLNRHHDIYIDDAVPGSDLKRPGLTQMYADVLADSSISHVFIYLPDRLARPEEPFEAALMEIELNKAGVTIVFSNRTSLPRKRGMHYFAENIQLLYQYTEAGEFLTKLAQRVIEGQRLSAQNGCWAGGRAPYGFVRVLVGPSGDVVQELQDGMKVRMEGHRTKIMPKDNDKIRVWVMILELYFHGKLGAKRIAQYLNDLEIPSPDAGRSRRDRGIAHRVTGRWGHNTVLSLIRNAAIIGLSTYGVQSEGRYRRYRRLGKTGFRLLEDHDVNETGNAKVIRNPREVVIAEATGFAPQVDGQLFEQCQQLLEERGRCQRGSTRSRDPSKYPLATRVWDLTDGCGHPMYAKTSGNRTLYLCGRFNKTAGSECHHNAIDGEAALQFVLSIFKQQIMKLGGREQLRRELQTLAQAERANRPNTAQDERTHLRDKLAQQEEELKLIGRNLARAKSDTEADAIREEFDQQDRTVATTRAQLARLAHREEVLSDEEETEKQVELALSLYDRIEQLTEDPQARNGVAALLRDLNVNLWLDFTEGAKGKRKVRVLNSGIITMGDAELPIRPYGNDGHDPIAGRDGSGVLPLTEGASETPSVALLSQSEGVSLTKVHRGDKI